MWMSSEEKVAVIGATGKTGTLVVEELKKRTTNVRVLARSKDKARNLLGNEIEIVDGFDFNSPASAKAGLKGAERLYLVSSSDHNWVKQTTDLIDLAKQIGIKHIVRVSVYGISDPQKGFSKTTIGKQHLEVDNYLAASGIAYTSLRPTWFHQNIPVFHGHELKEESVLRSPFGSAKVNFIDATDIAEVAAIALTGPGHENKFYELTGPQSLTMTEMAKVISDAIGKEIKFVDLTIDEARKSFAAWGLPPERVEALVEIYQVGRLGETADITNTVEKITGRSAISFADFAKKNLAEIGGKEESNEKLPAVGLQRQ